VYSYRWEDVHQDAMQDLIDGFNLIHYQTTHDNHGVHD
jgi:hypothetical protein